MPQPVLHEVSDTNIEFDWPFDEKINESWQKLKNFLIKDWANKEAYTQEDTLNTVDDQVQNLIFSIKLSKHERLANRLSILYDDAKEEDPTSVGISLGSLRNFYNFLQLYSNLKKPSITLSPDNNIYATWKIENCRFSMHFLPNSDINFVIFNPVRGHPERKNRLYGNATSDTLKGLIAPEIFNWILE